MFSDGKSKADETKPAKKKKKVQMADEAEEKKDEPKSDPFGNWDDVVGKCYSYFLSSNCLYLLLHIHVITY